MLSIGGAIGVRVRYLLFSADATAKASAPRLCMERLRNSGDAERAQVSKLLYIPAHLSGLFASSFAVSASVSTLLFSPDAQPRISVQCSHTCRRN